jgi:hypothetical protein
LSNVGGPKANVCIAPFPAAGLQEILVKKKWPHASSGAMRTNLIRVCVYVPPAQSGLHEFCARVPVPVARCCVQLVYSTSPTLKVASTDICKLGGLNCASEASPPGANLTVSPGAIGIRILAGETVNDMPLEALLAQVTPGSTSRHVAPPRFTHPPLPERYGRGDSSLGSSPAHVTVVG